MNPKPTIELFKLNGDIFTPMTIQLTDRISELSNADYEDNEIIYKTRWLTMTSYVEDRKTKCGLFWSSYSEINMN